MLSILIGPGRFGAKTHASWSDGQPVPQVLHTLGPDDVVEFVATGRELELILHAMNGDDEYLKRNRPEPSPLPGSGQSLAFVIVGMMAVAHGTNGEVREKIVEQAASLAELCAQAVTP